MAALGFEEARRAWSAHYEGLSQEQIDQRVLGFAVLIEGIARRGSVSPDEFASKLGVDPSRASEVFRDLATMGVEVDDQGNIVGAALTTRQTPHRVRLKGKEDLYAWCALDTLFIPGLLGEEAEVVSTCPVSGETVRVTVAPDGVRDCSPPEAVLSVVVPSAGHRLTGPASPT